MEAEEFERLIEITENESICVDSYMCLKEDNLDGRSLTWGWNKNLKNIVDHFLYVFILGNIAHYNEDHKINKITKKVIGKLVGDPSFLNPEFNNDEKVFLKLWDNILKNIEFKVFKKNSKKLCKFLTKLGYKMNFILYENPRKALRMALKLDEDLLFEEFSFGEFLRENLEDEE